MEKEVKYEQVIAIVNTGFADVAMDAARDVGARGGTVLVSRGTGNSKTEKKYGVAITPDKEMILIVVKENIKDDVMAAIYKAAGLDTAGHGICFSMPVSDVLGLKFNS